ncbi:MAG: hypothetical protein ABFD16_17765 [Thermoguttaceae bacterium]
MKRCNRVPCAKPDLVRAYHAIFPEDKGGFFPLPTDNQRIVKQGFNTGVLIFQESDFHQGGVPLPIGQGARTRVDRIVQTFLAVNNVQSVDSPIPGTKEHCALVRSHRQQESYVAIAF